MNKSPGTPPTYAVFVFSFFFRPSTACRILVPQQGIEPVPPALWAQSLSHWTTREVPPTHMTCGSLGKWTPRPGAPVQLRCLTLSAGIQTEVTVYSELWPLGLRLAHRGAVVFLWHEAGPSSWAMVSLYLAWAPGSGLGKRGCVFHPYSLGSSGSHRWVTHPELVWANHLSAHCPPWQADLMAPGSTTACGGTTQAWMSGQRWRPCWRPGSTTAPPCWTGCCTWWLQTARSATTTPPTPGRPCSPWPIPWTTVLPRPAGAGSMPSAPWPARRPWSCSATTQTWTCGHWWTVASFHPGPLPPRQWLWTASCTASGESPGAKATGCSFLLAKHSFSVLPFHRWGDWGHTGPWGWIFLTWSHGSAPHSLEWFLWPLETQVWWMELGLCRELFEIQRC